MPPRLLRNTLIISKLITQMNKYSMHVVYLFILLQHYSLPLPLFFLSHPLPLPLPSSLSFLNHNLNFLNRNLNFLLHIYAESPIGFVTVMLRLGYGQKQGQGQGYGQSSKVSFFRVTFRVVILLLHRDKQIANVQQKVLVLATWLKTQ